MYNKFFASQSVKLAVPTQPVPIHHYLRQPKRIVRAIAATSRIHEIGQDCYRLTMRPLKFFALKIEPTVDLKIWADANGTIYLKSVGCELKGIETINEHFDIQLQGTMQPCQVSGETYLKGGAELGLKIFLPPPFSMMPQQIVESTGNSLLRSILLKMKQQLMQQLLLDYSQWALAQTEAAIAA